MQKSQAYTKMIIETFLIFLSPAFVFTVQKLKIMKTSFSFTSHRHLSSRPHFVCNQKKINNDKLADVFKLLFIKCFLNAYILYIVIEKQGGEKGRR